MTLRLRINLIVGALTLLFTLAALALHVRNIRESVQEEVVAANRVALQLLGRSVLRYAAQGAPTVQAYLNSLGRVRSNDITLLDGEGRELYRSPPSPYKAGRDAPPWFEALVTPPSSLQTIDFPGGRVEVRANASRAILDAWDDAQWLLLAALVTTNVAVYWLVGRAARPFGQITDALNRVEGGAFDVALPPLPGREAATIGTAFNRMVGELRGHIETERRAARAEAQLQDSRALARWIDGRLEQERHLIARELHDELGQSVTAMRSMALAVAQRVAPHDAQGAQAARTIADEALRLYDAMHGIIPRLTPLVLDNFGLADALADLVARTRASHPEVAIDASIELDNEKPLHAELALALYRAAQEGIANALRHGGATTLRLEVRTQGGEVTLLLVDNGSGLPAEGWQRPGHYGLRWLAERASGLGGALHIDDNDEGPGGVRLRMRAPLQRASEAATSAAMPA
jgi:two-component system sensor histidine kinase UhpB